MLTTVPVRRRARSAQERAQRLAAPDPWLVFAGLLLLALGLLLVASASIPVADDRTGQPFYYLFRQGAYVAVGLVGAAAAFRLSTDTWYRCGPWLLLAAIGLLLLVLIPGVGKEVNGSMRWLPLGPINVQASEVAKLFTLVYLAGYLQRHARAVQTSMMAMLRPMLVLALIAVLLLLEPDFGAAVVLMVVALGMVFLAGVNIAQFALLQGTAIALMAVVLYASVYRRARLVTFLDPWADPFNSGFQLTQSLIAIGRGELFGVGLGASIQKLFYLPEAYTDFILAILAEEMGLVGVMVVIGLYAVIVWRAFAIGAGAERLGLHFCANLAYGIGLWFAVQTLVNMGVTMGVLPTKGLTLPLVSYGGSSLVIMCVALAVLLRIDAELRSAEPERSSGEAAAAEAGTAP